jgi:5-(carboxyamino)imidazole ribonucleotide synthase
MGYDGKGQYNVDDYTDFEALWAQFGVGTGILEGKVDFEKEISVVIARNEKGVTMPFAVSENIHKNGILDSTVAPAVVHDNVATLARDIAMRIVNSLDLVGIMAIEMFVTRQGDVLVNEVAPRPHNSGHWTMDACYTSQFEQFVRAICGLPWGSAEQHSKARMKNLIGADVEQWEKYLADPKAKLHLYGKTEVREGRKMGHVTMVGR